jgi:eukaryotic-like serine/threonine-protein kinase
VQEAEPLARQAFDVQMRTLGPDHRDTIESIDLVGTALIQSGRYEDARRLFLDTIDKTIAVNKDGQRNATVARLWYDLACFAALTGRRDAALDSLSRAFAAGYSDAHHARADDDLKLLRNDPRFERLLASAVVGKTGTTAQ